MVRAQAMLQMPPYLKINDNREDVISEDPEIAGHFQHNIIFTDITYGIPHKVRHSPQVGHLSQMETSVIRLGISHEVRHPSQAQESLTKSDLPCSV